MSCAVGSDAVVAVDIVQVSTCDNCSKRKRTNSSYFFFALTAAVILAPAELMLIAGAVKVRPHSTSIWIQSFLSASANAPLLEYSRSAALVIDNAY